MLNTDEQNLFEMSEMTAHVNVDPFVPNQIGELFQGDTEGVSTTTVLIDSREGNIEIVNDTVRGSAPQQAKAINNGNPVALVAKHMPLERVISPSEFQNVREFGSDGDRLATLESVRNKYLKQMKDSHALTLEQQRVQAIKGTLLNSTGGPVDLYAAFGASQIEVEMNLDNASTDVRSRVMDAKEASEESLGDLFVPGSKVPCGRAWFRSFVEHENVREAYQRWQDGAALRSDVRQGFVFGDVEFFQYRGSVDGTPLIGDNEAFLLPQANIYKTRFAPGHFAEAANTIGLPMYAVSKELDYGRGIGLLTESNPISFVSRPQAIIKLHRNTVAAP